MSGDRYRRRQRAEKRLEKELSNEEPSGGMFYVLDLDAQTKTKGLSYKQAMALWATLKRSMVFPMTPKRGT